MDITDSSKSTIGDLLVQPDASNDLDADLQVTTSNHTTKAADQSKAYSDVGVDGGLAVKETTKSSAAASPGGSSSHQLFVPLCIVSGQAVSPSPYFQRGVEVPPTPCARDGLISCNRAAGPSPSPVGERVQAWMDTHSVHDSSWSPKTTAPKGVRMSDDG